MSKAFTVGGGIFLSGLSALFYYKNQNNDYPNINSSNTSGNDSILKNLVFERNLTENTGLVVSDNSNNFGVISGGSSGKGNNSIIPDGKEALRFGFPGPINDVGIRQSYAYSFNRMLRNPNWANINIDKVAEHITKQSLEGEANREKSKFKEDDSIPKKFRSLLSDYFRSGFDRGHLAPAGNNKSSQIAMDETFYLTNISPQVGDGFNRHYWSYLEIFVRNLTKSFDDVYCITGPLYLPSQDPDTKKWYVKYQVIGNPPNVAVPTHFYKIVLTKNSNSPAHFIQGFVLPNDRVSDKINLENFIVPIEAIEKASGLEFFSSVDKDKNRVYDLCKHTVCAVRPYKPKIDPSEKQPRLPAPPK
ncbi:hypothetical protein BB559_007422 [Furculomyces boomerangus]|uniref:Endonuclease n=1 Tax=Furculomyces boomerangus TaxID=61424 RepID=A0A2T9XXF6_9FUNG|nr:hypothetical protein BB559_007422 [Furculomyces boomerangus]